MAGWKEWAIGEIVEAGDIQGFIQNQTVMVFDTDTARDTALTGVVIEGMMSYLKDTNAVEAYDGSAWVSVGQDLTTGTSGFTALSNGASGLSYQPVSHNYVINGGMDVWQRGDGPFTAPSDFRTADRWGFIGTSATITKQSFTPAELSVPSFGQASNYLRYSTTGANDPRLLSDIEDVRTLAGQTVTLSFWAKSSTADALASVILVQRLPSFLGNTQSVFSGSLTTSWQRVSFTLTLPSLLGETVSSGSKLEVRIVPKTNTALDLDIWGVQLEAGSIATPFKRNAPSLQGELAACQRYYFQSNTFTIGDYQGSFSGIVPSNNPATVVGVYSFPVTMRANPSVSTFNPNDGSTNTGRMSSVGNVAYSSISVGANALSQVFLSSTNTAGRDFFFQIRASAEL